jgi:hypothetical protein
MNDSDPIVESRALRIRSRETDAAPHTPQRIAAIITERVEALKLNQRLEERTLASERFLATLTMMLHEHVTTSLRDTTGYEWKKAFPSNSKAVRHFQSLHAIAKFLRETAK